MSKLKIGENAVDFNLPGVDGRNYSLENFRDSPLLAVVFSCVHCPYVRAWEGRMIDLQDRYASKGLAFAVINPNDGTRYPADNFDNMKVHAGQMKYNFPFLRDESQDVARAYGAERTPEIFLFGADRKLVYTGVIDDNYEDPKAVTRRYLRDAIDAALEGRPAPVESTPPVGCTIKWK